MLGALSDTALASRVTGSPRLGSSIACRPIADPGVVDVAASWLEPLFRHDELLDRGDRSASPWNMGLAAHIRSLLRTLKFRSRPDGRRLRLVRQLFTAVRDYRLTRISPAQIDRRSLFPTDPED